jgi:shikimate kinase
MNAAHRSIVLIGFMGTGKSSVGRRLADATGWPVTIPTQ